MEKELVKYIKKILELYFKYGIKSVTMDDVARELGISKKTLYQYVDDKKDLVDKVLQCHIDETDVKLRENFNTDLNAIDQLLNVMNVIQLELIKSNTSLEYDLKKYYPDTYNKIYEWRKNTIIQGNLNNIEKGLKEGLYRNDFEPRIVANMHFIKLQAAIDNGMLSIEDYNPQQVFVEDFIHHVRGLCNIKGIEYIDKRLEEINKQQKNN